MTKYLILLLFLFHSINSLGQDSKELYQRAKTSFEDGEINQSLLSLENCQQALGGSNAKIESLKCQALVMKSDWINAAIAYKNYERLIPVSAKYGEAYSSMLDIKKEIWNELLLIEKKKKEEQEKEIKDDLTLAKEQEKSQETSYNLKETKINETNEKELSKVSMQSKDKELLSLYKDEIGDSGSNLNKITTEIEKQNNPTSFLLSAIKNDDLVDFKYLVGLGADANWTNQKGESLLHLTITNDAYKIFEELKKHDLDIEQRDIEGNTPLIKAIINNKVKFFELLVQNGSSLTSANSLTLQSPFHYALIDSNIEIGRQMIKKGISPNDYIIIKNEKFTPLFLAVDKTKSIDYAGFLIQNGADVNKSSENGMTPLLAGVDNNSLDMVNFLLNKGADVNFQDEFKQTALHQAVRNEDPEMVIYLIQRGGANKKIKDSLQNTPLKLSRSIGNKEVSKMIKKNRSFIDLSSDYRNHENQYMSKMDKIEKKLSIVNGRENRFFYTLAYDQIAKYGFSLGTINQSGIGAYFTARLNDEILTTSDQNGTVDNTGEVTGGQFESWGNDWRFNDNTKKGVAEGLIGITKKITYPLWLYAGAGVSYNQTYWEMDIYDNLGDYYDTDWLKNTDEANFNPVFESGFIVDLSGFNIRGGVKTQKFQDFTLTLGIGFSLAR